MKVKEIMKRHLIKIKSNNKIIDACKKMRRKNVGFLLCYNTKNKFLGIVTDRDIIMALAIDYSFDSKIKDIITTKVVLISEDDEIEKVITLLSRYQITRLPVVNKDMEICGVISLSDIAMCDATNKYASVILKAIKSNNPPQGSEKLNYLDIDDFIL